MYWRFGRVKFLWGIYEVRIDINNIFILNKEIDL